MSPYAQPDTMGDSSQAFDAPIQQLIHLNSMLCDTQVKLASDSDLITTVYNNVVRKLQNPYEWSTFNRFMDIIFGNDIRNSEGWLHNVMRGPHGMDLVVKYVTKCVEAGMLPYDIAKIKIDCLIDELEILM